MGASICRKYQIKNSILSRIRIPKRAIHHNLRIVSDKKDGISFLVMEFIDKGNPAIDFWKQFAISLASLHKQTQPAFGLNENNYIGSLKQENNYCSLLSANHIHCH